MATVGGNGRFVYEPITPDVSKEEVWAIPEQVAYGMAFVDRANEALLLVGGFDRVFLLGLDRRSLQRELPVTGAVWDIAVSPNQELAAVAGNRGDYSVDIVQIDDGRCLKQLTGHTSSRLCFSPDGRFLAVTDSSTLTVYETANWTRLRQWPELRLSDPCRFTREGHLWGYHTPIDGAYRALIDIDLTTSDDWSVKCVAMLPRSQLGSAALHPTKPWIAITVYPGLVLIFDVHTHEVRAAGFVSGSWFGAEFTRDGRSLVSGMYAPNGVVVWSLDELNASQEVRSPP